MTSIWREYTDQMGEMRPTGSFWFDFANACLAYPHGSWISSDYVTVVDGKLLLLRSEVGRDDYASYDEGYLVGRVDGESSGEEEGYRKGYAEGEAYGYSVGYDTGYRDG